MNFLKAIGGIIAGTFLSIGSFLGIYQEAPQAPQAPSVTESQTLGAFNPAGGLTYRLQTSAGTTDTSIRLSSFLNRSGLPLTMTLLNTSVGYGTLDPQNPTRSEFISFTGITQNSDGTAILTGVTRGLSDIYPFTASTTQRLAHSGQSIFILSNSPQFQNEYAVKQNAETISGVYTFTGGIVTSASSTLAGSSYLTSVASSTFTGPSLYTATSTFSKGILGASAYDCVTSSAATEYCQKGYIDGVAIAGASNANTTTKGIVEEATVSEVNSASDIGGTGAKLFMTPLDFSVSNFASSTEASTATTTSGNITKSVSVTLGQKMLIFSSFTYLNGTSQVQTNLCVKRPSVATSTLQSQLVDDDTGGENTFSFAQLYTASGTETIEVYIGDSNCTYAPPNDGYGNSIVLVKFND